MSTKKDSGGGRAQRTFAFKNPTALEKNQYELVIDEMMNSEVERKYPELKGLFQRSFKNSREKRQAILAALDSDRRLFTRINRAIGTRTRLSPQQHIAELVVMLRDYVKIGDTERKLYGEVMTPIDLVEEMLDGLPVEVWKNPHLKWLDPANGCGIFPAIIVQRLMSGLAEWEPDEDARYKHIMEKMIHVCEFQPKNMFLYLCAFDPKDTLGLNVYTGSFLTEGFDQHAQEIWGVERFDVIVGNPPYQKESENGKKTHPIWDQFVEKSLRIVAEGGYLCWVHPSGWRAVAGRFKELQQKLCAIRLLSLKMNDVEAGMRVFGACTRFDIYTAKNEPNKGRPTKVRWQNGSTGEVNLEEWEFIPNGAPELIRQLLAKEDEARVEVINSSDYHTQRDHVAKIAGGDFKYPCIANVGVAGRPSKVYYSSQNNRGHFGVPKVVTGRLGINVFIDARGEYGLTQDGVAIVDVPENLERIKQALLSEKFNALNRMMDVNGMRDVAVNRKVLALFRKDFWKEFV